MRKFLTFFYLSLVLTANAQHISLEEAKAIASNFFQSTFPKLAISRNDIHQIRTTKDSTIVPYYIFNNDKKNSFVIVDSEYKSDPILGFSLNGSIDEESIPAPLVTLLSKLATLKHQEKLEVLKRPSSVPLEVLPLLTTQWNQGWPYNEMTPVLNNGIHCATGCQNTAQAQIMKYFNYPSKGKGKVSYECGDTILSLDLNQSVYDWSNMISRYEYGEEYTDAQKDAVALLMRDVGYANHTSYSYSSGASFNGDAWVDFFGYDKGVFVMDRRMCSAQEFADLMYYELASSRPILISGHSEDGNAAHAFVCDGYRNDGYFHYNFGWGGANDDFYLKQAFIYVLDDGLFGLQPDCGGKPCFTLGGADDFKYENGNILWDVCGHCVLSNVNFDYDVAIVSENTKTGDRHYALLEDVVDLSFRKPLPITENLPDGEYIVYPRIRYEKNKEWTNFTFADKKQRFIDLSVKGGVYTYTNNHIWDELDEKKYQVDGIYYYINEENEACVTFKNNRYNSYSGDVIIPESVEIDGVSYPVTEIGVEAFQNCKIGELHIAKTIHTIRMGGIGLCEIDTIIFDIPSSLKLIEGWGFNGCNIPNIKLPDGVKALGTCAFQSCYFNSVEIPSSVNFIGTICFNYCSNLSHVIVHWDKEENLPWHSDVDKMFNGCFIEKMTLYVPKGCRTIYENDSQWNEFSIVEEDDSDLVVDLIISDKKIWEVFNFSGIRIGKINSFNELNMLVPGVYIIRSGEIVRKVIIRPI